MQRKVFSAAECEILVGQRTFLKPQSCILSWGGRSHVIAAKNLRPSKPTLFSKNDKQNCQSDNILTCVWNLVEMSQCVENSSCSLICLTHRLIVSLCFFAWFCEENCVKTLMIEFKSPPDVIKNQCLRFLGKLLKLLLLDYCQKQEQPKNTAGCFSQSGSIVSHQKSGKVHI